MDERHFVGQAKISLFFSFGLYKKESKNVLKTKNDFHLQIFFLSYMRKIIYVKKIIEEGYKKTLPKSDHLYRNTLTISGYFFQVCFPAHTLFKNNHNHNHTRNKLYIVLFHLAL